MAEEKVETPETKAEAATQLRRPNPRRMIAGEIITLI